MKILYITPGCFDKGGISRYSRYQISALREIYGSNNVKVLSFLGRDDNSFELPFEVDWHGNNKGFFDRVKLVFWIMYYGLFFRPEVIHIAHVNYAGLCFLISKLVNAKLILNVYGLEVWTNLKKFSKFGLLNAHHIISDCLATKNFLIDHNLRKIPGDVTVIWDCVDTAYFRPYHTGFENIKIKYNLPDRNKAFIISTLGRMSKDAAYKGYDRLITASTDLIKSNNDVYILMIGRGDLIESLKLQAREAGVLDNIIFTGSVTDDELPLILSYGHLFSLVTVCGEGMGEGLPLTPLEAMACGLPIIVGNQDGSRESIFEESNGYAIDPFDLKLQSQLFNRFYQDGDFTAQLSKNCIEIVQKHFSYVSFKDKHIQMYNTFIRKV